MRRALKWGAGLAAGLMLALVLVVLLFDWGRLAPWAATRLSAMTGREVTIQALDIDWSWQPVVTLEGLRIANAPWAEEPLMADVERLRVRVSLPALLRLRWELPEVAIIRPRVRLEQNKEGKANWDFTAGKVAAEATTPDDRTEMPLIGDFLIEEGALSYRDQRKGIDFRSRISNVAARDTDRQVRVEGGGTIERKPFTLTLIAGSLMSLRADDNPYPVRLDLAAGGTELSLDGTMRDPIRLEGADFQLSLSGPDLAEIFPIFGIPTPTTAAYSLSGRMRRDEGLWRVDDLKGKVGESDLSGSVAINPRDEIPSIEAKLLSRQLRLIDLGGLIGLDPGAEDPSASVAPPGKILPDVPVELERLRAADMDVQFTGQNVVVPGLPFREVDFRLILKEGQARLDPLRFKAEIGEIAGTVVLDGRRDVPIGEFDLAIRNLGLRPFFKGTRFEPETEGALAGRIQVRGTGGSLSDILGTSDGEAVLVMENGTLSHLLVELAGLDAAEALANLITGDDAINVRCFVSDFEVKKGMMQSRTLVLDTADTNIKGRLALDLGQERMDGRLEPQPKDVSPLSARVPITLGGTFKDPAVGVEGDKLALKGGAAVALGVLLTPLAAIIPFLDAGGGEDSPCRSLINQAQAK